MSSAEYVEAQCFAWGGVHGNVLRQQDGRAVIV